MSASAPKAAEPPPLPEHLRALETALGLIAAAGRAAEGAPSSRYDLRPLARALERGTVAALDAYDARRDPIDATRDALVACDEALYEVERAAEVDAGLREIKGWLGAARDWLHVPEQHFARTRVTPEPPRELVASHDLPTLFRLARGTIAPRLDVASPLPPPDDRIEAEQAALAALPPKERLARVREKAKAMREAAAARRDAREDGRRRERQAKQAAASAEPRPGFCRGAHVAQSEEQRRFHKTRELFEDVCGAGLLRTPLLGDYWRGSIVFDRRMLRDVDAIAALGGGAVASLERIVNDSPAKDPSRAFGLAFTLGCFEGRDGLAAVERVAHRLAEEEGLPRAVATAFKLAPHPGLPAFLRGWLKEDIAALRAVAIEVLAHRGWAGKEELSLAARDASEPVAAAALLAAAQADVSDLGELLELHKEAKTAALKDAVAWATVLGSVSYPLDRLRGALGKEDEEHVLLPLALAGEHADAKLLVERYKARPSRALAQALGFGGPPEAIAVLLGTLGATEGAPELKLAAAFALQRLTGGELYAESDVPPEKIEVEEPADPPLPDDAPALRRTSGDPRDRPSPGAPDRMRLPTTDPAVWRAFLAEREVAFQGERRLRRGQPYTPALSWAELDNYQITPFERTVLAREITLKTGRHIPFDPVDFVPVQEQALRALAPVCEKASSVAGAWGKSVRRG